MLATVSSLFGEFSSSLHPSQYNPKVCSSMSLLENSQCTDVSILLVSSVHNIAGTFHNVLLFFRSEQCFGLMVLNRSRPWWAELCYFSGTADLCAVQLMCHWFFFSPVWKKNCFLKAVTNAQRNFLQKQLSPARRDVLMQPIGQSDHKL